MGPEHVFLIPGFFGFANLGDLAYFGHVVTHLTRTFNDLGIDARIHVVKTRPTAALSARAVRLLESMIAESGDTGAIHLIGHSSGGIDARVLLFGELPTALEGRIKTLVSIAAPHHGTPLASVFASHFGQRLLAVLSLSTMSMIRFGHVPISALLKIAGILVKLDDYGPTNSVLLDQLFDELLGNFSAERRRDVEAFFREIGADQSLVGQLVPQAMVALDTEMFDRAGVRHACVTTLAREPGLGSAIATGLDPSAQAVHALYSALYRLTATTPRDLVPAIDGKSAQMFLNAYGRLPMREDNDGIVPTRSQLHGELIAAVRCDHHDVIGHFHGPELSPPHYDWLATGSQFTGAMFDDLWTRIAKYLVS